MKPVTDFDFSLPPLTEEKLAHTRTVLRATQRAVAGQLLVLSIGAGGLLLVVAALLAPWSGARPDVLSAQIAVCLYMVCAAVFTQVLWHRGVSAPREEVASLVFFFNILAGCPGGGWARVYPFGAPR